ncbi:RNA 2'-phosphotransferase [Cerasicoccus maritimus]|uniref:RNA 2'-phosphotransferase n=1 Tax=Cerasicoccus maritimus TaxID=490089 RepID=UPI0028529DEA|nr:RNA 2'-phosphotransferase [Cerasicoccus maritimus]
MNDPYKKDSKFLSLILRHDPGKIGLTLDAQGWTDVDVLLELLSQHGKHISRERLQAIVENNDKQRFALSEDGLRIRANQGHSIDVDLALVPSAPPDVLYHGTATRFEASIREQGLVKQSRQHVHLSADVDTATKVGVRHGKPYILRVDTVAMARDGHLFYLSKNDVWLTDSVPARYLEFPD